MGDMEKIMAMVDAREGKREISDACARVIASLYHNGQASMSYAFASTGVITNATALFREMFPDYDALSDDEKRMCSMLGTYIIRASDANGTRPAVKGWPGMWL